MALYKRVGRDRGRGTRRKIMFCLTPAIADIITGSILILMVVVGSAFMAKSLDRSIARHTEEEDNRIESLESGEAECPLSIPKGIYSLEDRANIARWNDLLCLSNAISLSPKEDLSSSCMDVVNFLDELSTEANIDNTMQGIGMNAFLDAWTSDRLRSRIYADSELQKQSCLSVFLDKLQAKQIAVLGGQEAQTGSATATQLFGFRHKISPIQNGYVSRLHIATGFKRAPAKQPRPSQQTNDTYASLIIKNIISLYDIRFFRALVLTGAQLLLILILGAIGGYWLMHREVSRMHAHSHQIGTVILTVPTFVAALLFIDCIALFGGDGTRVSWIGISIVAVVASGVSFELAQVLCSGVQAEMDKPYFSLLRTWQYGSGQRYSSKRGFAWRLRSVLSYLVSTGLREVILGQRRSLSRRSIEPFILRAVEYNSIEYLRRRIGYILDALIILGVIFSVNWLPGKYFLRALAGIYSAEQSYVVSPFVQGMVIVIFIATSCRVVGLYVRWRLFRWK